MAAPVVEFVQEALDRNEAPHLVRICRATGCSLKEGQDALARVLAKDKDVRSVHVVVSTDVDPETNAIAGKTISLARGDPDDATDLYAVYRSTEQSSGDVDDALKNIMWFPRLDEGLGSNGANGAIASDITCDAASDARNLVLKAAESASVFSNFKTTGSAKANTLFPKQSSSSSSSSSSKAPSKKIPFFGSSSMAKTAPKQQAPPPSKKKSNVVDDSDEDDSEADDETPKFVKKASHHKRLRVCDDSDDDDEVEFMPTKKPSQPVKKDDAATTSPPEVAPPAPATTTREKVSRPAPSTAPSSQPTTAEKEDATAHRPQKRQKAVTKTRINDEGYMVTETVYEDVEEDERPPPSQAKAAPSAKLPAPPPKKKRVVKGSGSAKQSNLMDFFGKK